ncbi:MAG: hypothetical protein LW875_08615, partial [Proteobacteria bacterium]|nr:hypothetical protein [Pseudomonadota bacterium]
MAMFRRIHFILISLSIFLIGPASFANFCSRVHVKAPAAETSVELETELTARVSTLLTSKDGRVLSLFEGEARNHPQTQAALQKVKALSQKPIDEVLLDDLSSEIRADVMRISIIAQRLVFSQSAGGGRVIPHLKVKPEYVEKFLLREKVDLGSPETPLNGKLVELHLRSKEASGDLLERTASVYNLLGFRTGSFHMHIVMNLPSSWIQRNPEINTWRFIEYWRRINLFFEMRDMVEKGLAIIENTSGRYMNFAPLKQKEISQAFTYLTKATRD